MSNVHSPVVPARALERGRGGRWRLLGLFGLPLVALVGVLTVAAVTHDGDCGGPVPGCGNLLNAGEIHILIERITTSSGGDEQTLPRTSTVPAGERAILLGVTNAVRVDPGQCLTVEAGPFWTALTQVEQASDEPGRWVPIDEWGARVHLTDGPCEEGS